MPLLEKGIKKVTGLDVPAKKTVTPTFVQNDFEEGFIMLEYKDGKAMPADKVVLKGPFMPQQPFTFGGEQRLRKQWYPGNSEASVQVLGPQESEITLKGELKLKRFKNRSAYVRSDDGEQVPVDGNMRQVAQEYQELIDAMRLRGNVVYFQMGEWHRWGVIESVKFDLHTLAHIKYEITLFIIGFNQPKNCKILDQPYDDPTRPNKDLTNAALAAIDDMQDMPAEMPQTLSDLINGEISDLAGKISAVTSFVDEALTDIENIQNSVNRAIGLIKNARSFISKSARRINAISTSVSNLGSSVLNEFDKTVATVKNVTHINKVRTNYASLAALLAALQARFEGMRKTVPMVRHLVKAGDTLQKISIKYYNTADHWEKIYDHNKLTSTVLTVGSVLEIPKV